MIRGAAALLLVLPMLATGGTVASAEALPGTTCTFFPSDNIFNTDISTLPVNAQSGTWMPNMTQHAYLHPDFGTFAQEYGIPINVAPPPTTGATPTFLYDSESDHPAEGYPIDPNTLIEGGASAPADTDRHALVVDKNRCKLYELYNLQNFTTGQTPSAGSGATWDLSSDAMRPDGWTSADAAGLPIAPLLLRPDEILAGSITHAIRFTTHCTSTYIWPASHQAGSCSSAFPPMGARFRLKSSFDISHFAANTQVVLRAFQHYGLLLADNGSDWYFQGTTDDWWGTTAGDSLVSDLKTIPASQFEAVDESLIQAAAGSYRAGPLPARGGGILTSAPAVYSASASSADVFVRGTGNTLYTIHWTGSTWLAWKPLGGILTTGPGASQRPGASPQMDVWVAGTDRQLYHRLSADGGGTFGPWEALGGIITADPAAVSSSATRIDIFVRGSDMQLYYRYWTSSAGWAGWQALGGILTSAPAAASCTAGHLDVFVRGTDNAIYRKGFNGSTWSSWARIGGTWRSGPAATCLSGTTNAGLFVRGTDDGLWMLTEAAT